LTGIGKAAFGLLAADDRAGGRAMGGGDQKTTTKNQSVSHTDKRLETGGQGGGKRPAGAGDPEKKGYNIESFRAQGKL